MTMEGMPLTLEDKERIRKCLTEPSVVELTIRNLLAKHSVPVRAWKEPKAG